MSEGAYQFKCVSCHARCFGGKHEVICEDCRTGHSAALLDAFYVAVPEKFGTDLGNGKKASAAAAIPLSDGDRMWLRGIRAAIFANHPLTRMVAIDEALGLYDDEAPSDTPTVEIS